MSLGPPQGTSGTGTPGNRPPSSSMNTAPGPTTPEPRYMALPDPNDPSGKQLEEDSECGSMRVSSSELRYVGGDHWAAILDSIADLKDHFDQEEHVGLVNNASSDESSPGDLYNGENHLGGPKFPHCLLLYASHQPASRDEILAALPPKAAVDRYVSRYFNNLDLVASCQYIYSPFCSPSLTPRSSDMPQPPFTVPLSSAR